MYELDEMNMLPSQVNYIDALVDAGCNNDDDFSYIYKQQTTELSSPVVVVKTHIGSNEIAKNKSESAFNMLRLLKINDYCIFLNALLGFSSILNSFKYILSGKNYIYFQGTYLLLLLATLLNLMNTKLSRFYEGRNAQYLMGCHTIPKLSHELNSLASLVTFIVAPMVMAFTFGFQTTLDVVVLSFFVLCGIARLARYNIVVREMGSSEFKSNTLSSSYTEGLPISSSLVPVAIMNLLVKKGFVHDSLPLGLFCPVGGLEFHPIVLIFFLHGCGLVSKRLKLPVYFS